MKIQLLNPNATVPTRGTIKSAGLDLYASESLIISPKDIGIVPTGVAIALPINTCGEIKPRSGLAVKNKIDVFAGLIDEDYRGEIKVVLYNAGDESFTIEVGDRVAQLLIYSIFKPVIEVVDSLEDTERSSGGFGSTGIK